MRKSISLLLTLTLAAPLYARQAVTETMEVRVTNVDVVVVDGDGNPVHGLTKDDFTLLENGRRVEISNFYEETGASPAPAAESSSSEVFIQPIRKPKRLVIMIDESSLMPQHRDRTLDHLVELVRGTIGENDRAMVVTFNEGLTILQPFTSDHELLAGALEGLRGSVSKGMLAATRFSALQKELIQQIEDGEGGGGGGGGGPQRVVQVAEPTYESAMGDIRLYIQEEQGRNNRLMAALESIVLSLGGLEGRRSVVFVTNSLTRSPGIEALELMESIKAKFQGGTGSSPRSESQRFSLQNEFNDLTERASSLGVVVHALQGAPASSDMIGADFGVPSSFEATQGVLAGLRAQQNEESQTMRELAGATGGIALVGSSNIADALARIGNQLRSHYSLGYRPEGPRDATRRIEVRVDRPGVIVRHPSVIVDRSVEQEMEDRLATVLNFPETAIGHGLKVSAGASAAAEAGRIQVPLTLEIPMENLTLLPEGDDLVGSFTVHSAFLNRSGALSTVTVQQQGFRFPAESRNRRKSITLQLMLSIDPSVESVAIAVVDTPSQLAQVAVQEIAPAAPSQ